MIPLLSEFKSDLEKIRNLINLFESLKQYASIDIQEEKAYKLHEDARQCKTSIAISFGTLALYLGGRFEYFIRSIFEELCISIASKCNNYDDLPRVMKENLIKYTAEVISNPRKYGHAENGVSAFINVLNSNVSNKDVNTINSNCLSITYENMRPDTLSELFERIGAKDLWDVVAEQANIKVYFETDAKENAKKQARKCLNDFVDLRNKIAHPANDITWPEKNEILNYIKYFEELATAIASYTQIYEIRVTNEIRRKNEASA